MRGYALARLTDQSISQERETTPDCAPPPSSSTRRRTRPATSRRPTGSCARAAADGARRSSCCPEKWSVLGARRATCAPAPSRSTARPSTWARELARELGIDLVAGSISERVEGEEKLRNTSRARRPRRRDQGGLPQDPHVRRRGRRHGRTASPSTRSPATRSSLSATADGVELGLSVCYDLRFPELYRMLAVRGARDPHRPRRVHAADDARPLGGARCAPARSRTRLRHRRQPDRRARAGPALRRALDDRRPVGPRRSRRRPTRRPSITADLDLDAQAAIRARLPSLANRRPAAYRWPRRADGRRRTRPRRREAPPDPRRRGARVRPPGLPQLPRVATSPTRPASPTASSTTTSAPRTRCSTRSSSSAGTSCSTSSASSTARTSPPREKLYAIASFIVDSYRHDPELMKVIIVEVTRAANSFGRTHLAKIREAYELIAGIVERAQADGAFKDTTSRRSSPRWPSTARSSRC